MSVETKPDVLDFKHCAYCLLVVWPDIVSIVLFFKFGPHSKIQFEISTRLRHEFLETLARPEEAHFCLKFGKNKLKFRKANPVVAIRRCYEYLSHETKNTCGVWRME